MSQQSGAVLGHLLRDIDLGWMIDLYTPPGDAIPFLLKRLEAIRAEYRRRFTDEPPFTPAALTIEAARNPHKVRAFLQSLAASGSPEMLVMVWRILQGLRIRQVDMNYKILGEFNLLVVLGDMENDQQNEKYRSQDIFDTRLIRHFGIGTVTVDDKEKPVFDGFFPERRK